MAASPGDPLADLLRTFDRDRFLCDLFVPADRRRAVMAVHAFGVEVARVRELVSEPMPGEIRLQWWRDALQGEARGAVESHPVAAPLLEAVSRFDLPRAPLLELVEARSFDLYDDPIGTLAELESYAAATAGTMLGHALLVTAGRQAADPRLVQSGGAAYAMSGLMRALPLHASQGRLYLPLELLDRHGAEPATILAGRADAPVRAAVGELVSLARGHLAIAREAASQASAEALPALLPLALVEADLARLERAGFDPFAVKPAAGWRRQWRVWSAARRGRV